MSAKIVIIDEDELKNLIKNAVLEGLKSVNSGEHNNSLNEELLSIKEAAEYLKTKVTTLYNKTSKNLIPFVKKGNKLYFIKEELKKWLQSGNIKIKTIVEQQAEKLVKSMIRKR